MASRPADRRGGIGAGLVLAYLSLLVLIPLAAVVWRSGVDGASAAWQQITAPQPLAALRLTVLASAGVALANMVLGTLIAWLLVRDDLPGRALVDALIDLPFALPTVVAGLVLLTLYGPGGAAGFDLAYTRAAVLLALLFVTLPFVVRTVQGVLLNLDRDMESAALSLGASPGTVLRRIVLPNLAPAMLTGAGLAFARAIGEFGSVSLLSGNLPFRTEVSAVNIYNQVESDNLTGAAAQSTVLLLISLLVLAALQVARRRLGRHG